MRVFLDGRAVPLAEARIPLDRGHLLGDGLFETLEVRGGVARFPQRHLARLRASASELGFVLPDDMASRVDVALTELWNAEGRPERAVLRITVTRGGGRGLDVDHDAPVAVLIGLGALPERVYGEPSPAVEAVVVPGVPMLRVDPLGGHKTTSRAAFQAARVAARTAGAERGLRPFEDGSLACADAASVFVVTGGVLRTPAGPGLLPGVTRARVLEAFPDTRVERIAAGNLAAADEVFLTNALCCVEPVARLDGRELPDPGPVARSVARALDL